MSTNKPRKQPLAGVSRRLVLGAVGSAVLVGGVMAQSPTRQPLTTLNALGVYVMLGDRIELTVAEPVRNVIANRFERRSVDVPQARFDAVAMQKLREVAQSLHGQARLHFYRSRELLAVEQQRQVVADARAGGLPAWIVQTVEQQRLSHVLLVTRETVPTQARTGGPGTHTVGRGTVSGLGWYVDPTYMVANSETRVMSGGLLIPHVVLRLTLMDVDSAAVVRNELLDEQWVSAPRQALAQSDPWSQIDDNEKVQTLRDALAGGLEQRATRLLQP
jgi:hypothetical protein